MLQTPPYTNPLPVWSLPITGGHQELRWHDAKAFTYRVVSGSEVASVDGGLGAIVLPARQQDVAYCARMSRLQQALEEDPDWQPHPVSSTKVRLSWSGNLQSPDHYRIYWDGGLGGEMSLMAQVENATTYTTPVLESGTYKFQLCLSDSLGNENTHGSIVTVQVLAPPEQPTATISYSSATRQATLSFSGLCRVRANLIPGVGLQTGVVDPPVSTCSDGYTTTALFAGDWMFSVRAVSAQGIESAETLLKLSLIESSGALVELEPTPSRPIWVGALPAMGGMIEVQVEPDASDEFATEKIKIYAVGVLAAEVECEYPVTTVAIGPFANGTTVSVAASAMNEDSSGEHESPRTDPVYATADSEAPAGDTTLSAEAIS